MMIKCKMCGGDLNFIAGATTCECEFCGTTQTVPVVDNEKKANLFNRANRLRMSSEFDKAASVYESIVAEFPEEAEAYWGLCLCTYGIEYVDDAVTSRKIPTCHRTRQMSIMDDGNFDMACEYADAVAKKLYRDEAKEIDRLQRAILQIVAQEEPYDVFICYKETGADGSRTEDSVLAQDMYDALTAKGLKVFFARITLEDKLGKQYEPYIYAALHSAKVMLAVGSSFEHYDAVWVKNEWSRFLAMMKEDRQKTLIPCYKGIDAYDIPKEFRNLQAQDMGKLGWLQDLTRGVAKLCGKEPAGVPNYLQMMNMEAAKHAASSKPLTDRGYIYLEDCDFTQATGYFDRALDENPTDSRAYLGKFLAALKKPALTEAEGLLLDLDTFKDFDRACRFADSENREQVSTFKEKMTRKFHAWQLVSMLEKYANKRQIAEIQQEIETLTANGTVEAYDQAIKLYENIREQKALKNSFSAMGLASLRTQRQILVVLHDTMKWHSAAELHSKVNAPSIYIVRDEIKQMYAKGFLERDYAGTEVLYGVVGTADNCNYQAAEELRMEAERTRSAEKYQLAAQGYERLNEYRDAPAKREECLRQIEVCKKEAQEAAERERACQEELKRLAEIEQQKRKQEAAERAALHEKLALERKRLAEQDRIRQEEARRRHKRLLSILAILTVVALAVGLCVVKVVIPQLKYNKADTLLAESKYDEAIAAFSEIANWKDSESKLDSAYYAKAEQLLQKGDYSAALKQYQKAGNYKDTKAKIERIKLYSSAVQGMKKDTKQARHTFAKLGDFLDAKSNYLACCEADYETAVSYLNNNSSGLAHALFVDLGDYSDSAKQAAAIEAEYAKAETLLAEGKHAEAISIYTRLGTYADSEQKQHAALLAIAEELLAEGKYDEAVEQFTALNETERVKAAEEAQNAERLRLADEALAAHDYATAFENYLLIPQTEDVKAKEYSLAQAAYDEGLFEYAVKLYEQLGQYELSVSRLPVARYAWADQLFEQGSYQTAAEQFRILGDFTDSADRINSCLYAHGKQLMDSEAYDAARVIFTSLGNYEDAKQLGTECIYRKAMALMQAGSHDKASLLFASITYADSAEKHLECEYLIADAALAAGDYVSAQIKFESLGEYKDATDKHKLSTYRLAYEYHTEARYADAQRLFTFLGDYEDSVTMVHECRMQKALSFQQQGKYSEALKELEDIDHVNRELVYTQCNMALAKAAEEKDKKEEAIVFYGKASSEEEAQDKLYTFGKEFAAANQMEQAIETFYLAGAHAPSQAYLADISSVLESTGKTLQAYICRIAANDNADAHWDKILTVYSCETVIDTLDIFSIQQDDNGMRGNLLYSYSQALQRAGRKQDAETVQALIKMHKEVRPLIYARAVALLNDGQYDKAIAEFTAIQGYRDSADKIELCRKNRLVSMYTPTAGMFVWDKEKDDDIAVLEAYEVYYAGDYVKDSVLYPFLKLHNSTTSSKTVKVRLNIDGMTISYNDTTIEAGANNRFYYSTYAIGTHTLIWYIDNIEVLNVTYTIQSGKSSENVQMADVKAGNYVTFGAYEQDNNSSNGKEPIEWLVLAREENKLLLLSRYALATQLFSKERKAVTWETSSVRQWLANDFFNTAFSAEEQAQICSVTVPADKNPAYNTDPGNATQDHIFLLSSKEARTYFPLDNSLLCWPTAHLKSKIKDDLADNGTCWWWLRTPGESQYDTSIAYRSGGGVNDVGLYADTSTGAIRPTMWLEIPE